MHAHTYTGTHMHFKLLHPGVAHWKWHLWETPLYDLVRLNSTRQRRTFGLCSAFLENLRRAMEILSRIVCKATKPLPALHSLDALLFYPSHTLTFKIRTQITPHTKSANATLIWILDTVLWDLLSSGLQLNCIKVSWKEKQLGSYC